MTVIPAGTRVDYTVTYLENSSHFLQLGCCTETRKLLFQYRRYFIRFYINHFTLSLWIKSLF